MEPSEKAKLLRAVESGPELFVVVPGRGGFNESMPDPDLNGLSILIVEDEALLRKRLTAQLEQLRADVTGATTLKEAR